MLFSYPPLSPVRMAKYPVTSPRREEKQLEFVFDTTSRQQFPYFRKWMKEQKAAKQAITWGDALSAIIGTVTTINGKYRVWD